MSARGLIPWVLGSGAAYYAYKQWDKKGCDAASIRENPHGIDPEDLESDPFDGIDPEDLSLEESNE